MSAVSETVDGRKVYRPNPGSEQSALIFGIGFLTVLLLVPFIGVFIEYRKTGDVGEGWIGLAIFLGLLIVAAVVRGLRRPPVTYLALSPDGLEYQGGKRAVTASWNDVLKLRYDDEPILIVRAVAAPRRFNDNTERISLLPFDFEDDSELARDLQLYAPHLFR